MITLHEIFLFLAPAVGGAALAVIVFQIVDRLNLFYQNSANAASHRKAA
jgi:hypothetical protein